jgi:hypothetical protein
MGKELRRSALDFRQVETQDFAVCGVLNRKILRFDSNRVPLLSTEAEGCAAQCFLLGMISLGAQELPYCVDVGHIANSLWYSENESHGKVCPLL